MHPRSRTQCPHVLPLSDPARTVALDLSRWSDSPDDPLCIRIDYTLLDRLGWRPGDRITFEPIALDRRTGGGGLVVRRATADEPSIKLRRDHYQRKDNPYAGLIPDAHDGPDGPDVEWPCPPEWIESFFPMEYIPGPGAPVFIEPSRTWLLRDLLDQRDEVVVFIDCSYLEFRLQRTDPNVPTLDVHLPAGVLHLMDWSPSTPLALTSGTGFDPSATEDLLTIRRSLPGESNLAWDGAKFIASPSPDWLARYFPGFHDNEEEIPHKHPHEMPSNPDPDCGNPDLIKFQGPAPPEREFIDEDRDTFCVHYRDFQLGQESLTFAIPETSHVWD